MSASNLTLDKAFFDEISREITEAEVSTEKSRKRNTIKFALFFWGSLAVLFALFPVLLPLLASEVGVLIFVAPIIYYTTGLSRARDRALEKVAERNQGTYKSYLGPKVMDTEAAIMLKRRAGRTTYGSKTPRHWANKVIEFKANSGHDVRIFEYGFDSAGNEPIMGNKYMVLGVKGFRNSPHFYINYKHNQHNLKTTNQLSLPAEFEKEYSVSIPEDYEIEGLQIFTPDVVETFLRLPIRCDMEIVDGEILFYFEEQKPFSRNFEYIGEQVEGANKLIKLLQPKFNTLRWAPVGDMSVYLPKAVDSNTSLLGEDWRLIFLGIWVAVIILMYLLLSDRLL